jgi:hypothetical protein
MFNKKQKPTETYRAFVKCLNCEMTKHLDIPVGTPIGLHQCPNCKCSRYLHNWEMTDADVSNMKKDHDLAELNETVKEQAKHFDCEFCENGKITHNAGLDDERTVPCPDCTPEQDPDDYWNNLNNK